MAFMLIKILAPGYFARQDTRTPVKIGIIAMVANMALNLALIWPLQHAGLALATSLSAWLNAGLLYIGLRRGGVYRPMKGWWQHGLRLALAGGAMAGAIYWLARQATVWLNGALWDRILWLGLIVVAGLAVYLLALLILGLRPRHLRR
jgi:putative peptidoglycan lipid II flippase